MVSECVYRDFQKVISLYIQKGKSLRDLQAGCNICEGAYKHPVPIWGNIESSILIVDRAPGYLQSDAGWYLETKSPTYRLMSRVLSECNISFQDCAVTFSPHCRGGDRRCFLWLKYEIDMMHNLKAVVALGRESASSVLDAGYNNVVCMEHPWVLLHNPGRIDSEIIKVKEFLRNV